MKDHVVFTCLSVRSEDSLVHVNIEPRLSVFHGLYLPQEHVLNRLCENRFVPYQLSLKNESPMSFYEHKILFRCSVIDLEGIDAKTVTYIAEKLNLYQCKTKTALIKKIQNNPGIIEQIFLLPAFSHLYGLISPLFYYRILAANRMNRLKSCSGKTQPFKLNRQDNREMSFNSDSIERVDINDLLLLC